MQWIVIWGVVGVLAAGCGTTGKATPARSIHGNEVTCSDAKHYVAITTAAPITPPPPSAYSTETQDFVGNLAADNPTAMSDQLRKAAESLIAAHRHGNGVLFQKELSAIESTCQGLGFPVITMVS
jgi:hypothetical protein